jgi:hypothetical protein
MANFILTDYHYPTINIDGVGVYNELICSKARFKVIPEVLLKKMQALRCDSFSVGEYFQNFAAMAEPSQRPATKNICKTRGCNYSF